MEVHDPQGAHAAAIPRLRRVDAGADHRVGMWARKVGPSTAALLDAIMGSKVHPQQGFKRRLGILRLAKHYPPERLERACVCALVYWTLTYKRGAAILQNKLDDQPLPGEEEQRALPSHENLRGSRDYLN